MGHLLRSGLRDIGVAELLRAQIKATPPQLVGGLASGQGKRCLSVRRASIMPIVGTCLQKQIIESNMNLFLDWLC